MVKNNYGLLRVFWPNTVPWSTSPGVIIGWRNDDYDLMVVTVLEDADPQNVDSALRVGTLFRSSPYPVARIFQLCDRPAMHVLGLLNHPEPPHAFDVSRLRVTSFARTKTLQVFCPYTTGLNLQVIYYDPPNPRLLEYMSLEPINLALGGSSHLPHFGSYQNDVEVAEEEERTRIAHLVSKLKYHTVTRHHHSHKETILPTILRQINCAQELGDLIQKNAPYIGTRRKRSMSVSERVVESAQGLYAFAAWSLWSLFMAYIFPLISLTFRFAILLHRVIAEGVLWTMERQLPIVRPLQVPDSTGLSAERLALKDVSASCQQIHLRLQQFSYYPSQYGLLRKRHDNWSSIPSTNADYIRFYNSLWLVANDVIIGIAVGGFINENAMATSNLLENVLKGYTVEGLKRVIRWLMSYPGGLKLNTELAAFLGDLFLWVIEYWAATIDIFVVPYLPVIIYFIGCSSFVGASMSIAMFSDLLSFLTLHIYSFYIASARIFNWQLTIIVSLFHLFRGKKRNVLRNRIDNCDYDLDQLLLGTILFTLLFFLLPTVIVFYITFASARMAIITSKAGLDTCLAFLNHFPLFALMLRVKDSNRLPAGIHFRLLKDNITPTKAWIERDENDMDEAAENLLRQAPLSHIRLSSTPLSIRQIFSQYSQLGSRIKKHYLSGKVVLRLLTGRFVPPLGRREMYGMQYSALPRERISVSQLWKELFERKVDPRLQDPYAKAIKHRLEGSGWASFGTSQTRSRWR